MALLCTILPILLVSVSSLQNCQFRADVQVKSATMDARSSKMLTRWLEKDEGVSALLGAAETIEKEEVRTILFLAPLSQRLLSFVFTR